jgi:hypothetical protein
MMPDGPGSEEPSAGQADGPAEPTKPAWWLWTVVGAILVVIVTASVIIGSMSPGGDSAPSTASGESSSPAPSNTGATSAPGVFGTPSLPANDPVDPWKGVSPIAGVEPGTFKSAMTKNWKLDFRSRPMRGGIQESGLAGDLGREQRRLDAIIKTGSRYAAYEIMCQAGGTKITPTDDTSLGFVYDCLNQAVRGEEWNQLKGWLDQNLKSMAGQGGTTWYQLPSVRVYVESDAHILSCTLVNF